MNSATPVRSHRTGGIAAWLGAMLNLLVFVTALGETLNVLYVPRSPFDSSEWTLAGFLFPAALLGLVLGAIGAWRLEKPLKSSRPGRTSLAAIFAGVADIVLVPLMLAAGHHPAPVNTAVGNLRTIVTANVSYQSSYESYAPSLANLGGPAPCRSSAETACLIDQELSSGHAGRFKFVYVPGAPDNRGKITSYAIWAEPDYKEESWYYTDQSGVIRDDRDKRPTEKSPGIQ